MRYDEVISQRYRLVYHSFGHVQTQQSPCSFRVCQSYLQSGIIKSVLQRQRREYLKGIYNFLNFHIPRKFGAKISIFRDLSSRVTVF